MDLSVVLLSYNTRELTEQALRTVFDAGDGLELEVFVVDNASRDGSAEMVAERFPRVRLIRNDRNRGFAAGNNVALRQVTGRYVLLLNTDTIVRRDTLRTLVEFLDAHPEVGAAGCRILNPDGTLQLDSRRAFPGPFSALCKITGLSRLFPRHPRIGRYNLTYLDPEALTEVEVLSGSCMMVRKATMDQVGMLDEDYFMYGEDVDWCWRIHAAGWRIYYVPWTEIIHFRGESGRSVRLRVQYRKTAAMSIFVRKHMRARFRYFPVWVLHLGIAAHGLFSLAVAAARRLALPVADALLVTAGVKVALAVRYHPALRPVIRAIEETAGGLGLAVHPTRWLTPPPYTQAEWLAVHLVPAGIWVAALWLLGLYDRRRYSAGWAALAVALGFAGVVTTVFFLKAYNFSRLAAVAAWAVNTVLIAGWRLAAGILVRTHRLGRRRTLVIGTDVAAVRFAEAVQRVAAPAYELVGLVAERPEERGGVVAGRPVVGLVSELEELVRRYGIEQLVFTPGAVPGSLEEVGRRWGRRSPRLGMLPASFAGEVPPPESWPPLEPPLIELTLRP